MDEAAIYARVSDKGKQGDNFSIGAQLDLMRAHSISQDWHILEELSETDSAFMEGLSRSQLNRALELARSGKINVLMFFSPDRFTRDMADGVILRRELKRYGVKLVCYYPTPHEITSDMEVMHILTDWQSQQYIERMREASMRGYMAKLNTGLFAAGQTPYGYETVGKGKETQIIICEDEAVIVMLIFQLYTIDNLTTVEIAHKLTDMHLPTPGERRLRHRKRESGIWNATGIGQILRDEVYMGTWYGHRYQKISKKKRVIRPRSEWIPIPVPTLVSKSTWEEAKRKLTQRDYERRKSDNIKHHYLMSRRANCQCTFNMAGVAHPNKSGLYRIYYHCQSSHAVTGYCGAHMFKRDLVDTVIWEFIKELATNPEKVLRNYQEAQRAAGNEQLGLRTQIELVATEIADYSGKLQETLDHRERAKIELLRETLEQRAEHYAQVIEDLQKKASDLTQQLETRGILSDDEIMDRVAFLKAMAEEIGDIEEQQDFAAQRRAVELLDLRCRLRTDEDDERWCDILWLRRIHPRKLTQDTGEGTHNLNANLGGSARHIG
jgi:site-specific DNA recombinase